MSLRRKLRWAVLSFGFCNLLGCSASGGEDGTPNPPPGGLNIPDCMAGQALTIENDGTIVCKSLPGGSVTLPMCKTGEAIASDGGNLVCVAVQDTTSCPNGVALKNPSFEAPRVAAGASAAPPGWQADAQMPAIIRPTGKLNKDDLESPGHGTQVLSLPGDNSQTRLQTDLMTTKGKSYTMTFAAAQPLGSGGAMLQGSLGGGESAKSFQVSDVPVGSWKELSVTVTADNQFTGKLFFRIGNAGKQDVYIDNLCLTSN